MKQIGIMGGTFDPPHIGHLLAAERVYHELSLDEVRFIPTGKVTYKDSLRTSPAAVRAEMTAIAVSRVPYFVLDAEKSTDDTAEYTFQTLQRLKEREPDAAFTFIAGADSLDYMDSWREPERIFCSCRIAAVMRPGFSRIRIQEKIKQLKAQFGADIVAVSMPQVEVSSTEIRERIRRGDSVRYLVPDEVLKWISENNIYRR